MTWKGIAAGALLLLPGLLALGCGDDDDDKDAAMTEGDGDGDEVVDAGDGDDTPAGSASWTHMGYDERNWYFNPHEDTLSVDNADDIEELWRFEVAGFPPGSPLIVDDTVYVMSTGGTYAINLENGKERWSRKDIAGTASLAYADGSIYAHANGAKLFRLNAEDGETIWGPEVTYELAGCDGTSSPIVAGDVVIVGHSCGVLEVGRTGGGGEAKGGVEAHNIEDGDKAWRYSTVEDDEDGAMVWSTVGVDVEAKVVYAATGNNYTVQGENSDAIHAIDLGTGKRLWKTQVNDDDLWSVATAPGGPDSDFGANPIVLDDMVAAGEKSSGFWALNAEDGEIEWSREELTDRFDSSHGGFLMNGAFDGEYFYGVVNTGGTGVTKLYAMAKKDGKDRFEPKVFDKNAWGAPSVANGLLFVPIDDELFILNKETGKQLNHFETGGTIAAGAPAVAHGHVVVGSGLSYIFDANTKNNNEIICYGLPD